VTPTTWLVVAIVILALLCLALAVLASPVILIALLRPALMCADGKSRKPAHIAAGLIAWVADLVAARTVWAWFIGGLHPGEKTISDTLERLAHPYNMLDPNHALYVEWSKYINRVSPTKAHIKVVL
jgi:hypothetical protein